MRDYLPELVALPLLPLLLAQGRRTRRITPRLPEAPGATDGIAGRHFNAAPLRMLAFGESPVAGVGVQSHEEAITGCLAQALAARLRRPVHWEARGQNGATVRDAMGSLLPHVAAQPQDLVLVAFGVNDTTAFRSAGQWRQDVRDLLDALEARCAPRLMLVSGVPPMGRFPALPQPLRAVMGLKSASLDRVLRALVRTRANTLHVPLPSGLDGPGLMAHDGYHSSAAGCSAWAAVLADSCAAAFGHSD
ncbi:MAG TPA: SGNH/GDSL hydrolase family protein [Noviherbaspirillum sp.]|nr:SGNH/GDSL hydrolase family protein [Noviherbaspirillum sp.]